MLAPSPQSPRKFWEGPIVYVVIDDPEQIRKVLSSKYCIDKPKSAYGSFAVPEGRLKNSISRTIELKIKYNYNLSIPQVFL